MANNEIEKKYLSYEGLQFYTKELKKYYSAPGKGKVGLADSALKLSEPRKITFIGGVSGDGTFDGANDLTISTELNISGTLDADISGTASKASNFAFAKPISIEGDVSGYAVGGTDSNGWKLNASLSKGSVTDDKLAGNIGNDKLKHSHIVLGSTSIRLGDVVTAIEGLDAVSATAFVGNLEGNAASADKASRDGDGNIIVSTYATKAELLSLQSAIRFKGSVDTKSALPATADNGDIYNVLDEGKSYIWSSEDGKWSVFGTSYGPATSTSLGLVQIGSNITNESGVISVTKSNVESALGYAPIKGVTVNGADALVADGIARISIPENYVTQEDIDKSINNENVIKAIGYVPVENVSVNGVDISKSNNRVNIDLTEYATQEWTSKQIDSKVSSLYSFRGSLNTYGDLLNIAGQKVGDTYNIIVGNDSVTENPNWPSFNSGTNFAWDGDEWDSLGGSLDLSSYYKKDEVDTLLRAKSSVDHSHDERYYTQSQVDAIVADIKSWVKDYVASYIEKASDEGDFDDIRTYSSYSALPAKGIEDVQYIVLDTGLEYVWVSDNSVAAGGYYKPVNETVDEEDILSIFKNI